MYLRDGSAQTIFTCCHTEMEVADLTFYLTQSQYTDTGPTSPGADPITPGAWQGQFLSHWYDSTPKKSRRRRDSNPGSSALEADALPLGQRGNDHRLSLFGIGLKGLRHLFCRFRITLTWIRNEEKIEFQS